VIIEFALLGARRHRLEELAPPAASARAALRGMNDLTLMLAGAQLGITACTFALGAVTKPAVDAWLRPVLVVWGLPDWAAGGTSFALALFFVTFLHLVVGEMAPKSWAIAHPETSALAIGVISRAYIWPLRPLLRWVNSIANRLVRASGVEPVESAASADRTSRPSGSSSSTRPRSGRSSRSCRSRSPASSTLGRCRSTPSSRGRRCT
jgi:CBS domain containing-hemolysin-like protein